MMAQDGRLRDVRAKGLVRVMEVWFDDEPDRAGCDLLLRWQRSRFSHPRRWMYFNTLLFDLTRTERELVDDLKRTTRQDITRAADRDHITCHFTPSPSREEVAAFCAFYDRNIEGTGRREMNADRLWQMREAGLLQLAEARGPDGTVLVMRANLCHRGQGKVRGLFGVTLATADRSEHSMAGRANRFLHLMEMFHYKLEGYRMYDFGGWYAGDDDPKRMAINHFKAGFGGRLAYGYDCEEPVTWKGWLYLLLRNVANRLFRKEAIRERERRRMATLEGGVNQAEAFPKRS
jgi:hypothetical protein